MKELQAKAKVTQTMTRDGLVVENQADGTVENVSSREAEQDYSTDAEGKAEKILERAEDIKDGHENKKKAKKAAETAATAESEDGLHGSPDIYAVKFDVNEFTFHHVSIKTSP